MFTTIPRSAVLDGIRTPPPRRSRAPGSLKGMRIGIIRESMLTFPGIKADEPIVQAANAGDQAVLGDYLGATLVESSDPKLARRPGDREHDARPTPRRVAELIPVFFPDILYRVTRAAVDAAPSGRGGREFKPVFPDFAAAIKPTAFAPGETFGSGTMRRPTTWWRSPTAGCRRRRT